MKQLCFNKKTLLFRPTHHARRHAFDDLSEERCSACISRHEIKISNSTPWKVLADKIVLENIKC